MARVNGTGVDGSLVRRWLSLTSAAAIRVRRRDRRPGPGRLTLLFRNILGAIPSTIGALVYLLVFGVGSTAGMLLSSGLIGLPVALAAPGVRWLQAVIQVVAGIGSSALGIWMLAGPAAV